DELNLLTNDALIELHEGGLESAKTHSTKAAGRGRDARRNEITPTEFAKKYERNVQGGKKTIERFFRGKTRKVGERPEGKAFSLGGGLYDEDAIVAHLRRSLRFLDGGW